MRIQQLPVAVANQIAAGEVIERPASVVKELLENALDAGASIIHIDISHGGVNQIKVSDNGVGIIAEDLPLAIAPHATSKIRKLQDLYSIASMGFRGEALASIASVSRLTISSKPPEQQDAMRLVSDGQTINIQPCARSQGTTVDVRDLFFNAPVRKKFLKTERLELQAIETVVKRFALSAPEITITLNHNDKKLLHLPGAHNDQSKQARIRRIFGKSFLEQSAYIEVEHLKMRLFGWIGRGEFQRSQNDKQWIYINLRMVKDKLLSHAVKQAYEGLLHPGRYPAYLLYLSLNPEDVDVNVHPTKHEVRFQQPRLVHDFVSSQIQRVLQAPEQIDSYKIIEQTIEDRFSIREPRFSSSIKDHKNDLDTLICKKWITLHDSFALVMINEKPYLIDVLSLQHAWLKSILMKQKWPLVRRPLLVPVTHSIEPSKANHFHRYESQLNQIGIEIDLMSENTFLIRSLPIVVPYLNLKQLLTAIFKEYNLTNLELMELLITHQNFEPKLASQEEKEALLVYMHSEEADAQRHKWSKHLSTKLCWDLFNA
ncbi:DNA mismatch repair protein MutL [Legionella lansingensis]|uniref:DNA mismatch repair protein MutL n=1 Tax=Legionella lansingensis TaxID=45067 RepID=A0A0W0VPH2_9GAMM|nr:DNA mismatch repair endonuclease MutL [Legionella lansingensis]KTD22027.1 DNA mismatch repair protein MutL [Legionella lansingensis]SNV54038.1 DNA mismatch repair protein MutL [Legionella lansingensis]